MLSWQQYYVEGLMKKQLAYIGRNLKYIAPWKWKAGTRAIYRRLSGSGVFISKSELGMCALLPVRKVDKILLVPPDFVVFGL